MYFLLSLSVVFYVLSVIGFTNLILLETIFGQGKHLQENTCYLLQFFQNVQSYNNNMGYLR